MPRDYRSRADRLTDNILVELDNKIPDIKIILDAVDEFEADNLNTIKKLKRKKKVTTSRISGAIKQFIDAHPVITKQLIGSMTKRIYGSLLELEEEDKRKLSIRDILIGLVIGLIFANIFWVILV